MHAELLTFCADVLLPELLSPRPPLVSPWFVVDPVHPAPAPAPAPAPVVAPTPTPAPAPAPAPVVAPAPAPPAVVSTVAEEPAGWLSTCRFASVEAALHWLQGDCYTKVQTAVSVFGVACPADMMLLQAVQVAELPGIRPGIRRRMATVLTNAVASQQQVQMVYDRHTEWMQTSLGVDHPGVPSP